MVIDGWLFLVRKEVRICFGQQTSQQKEEDRGWILGMAVAWDSWLWLMTEAYCKNVQRLEANCGNLRGGQVGSNN